MDDLPSSCPIPAQQSSTTDQDLSALLASSSIEKSPHCIFQAFHSCESMEINSSLLHIRGNLEIPLYKSHLVYNLLFVFLLSQHKPQNSKQIGNPGNWVKIANSQHKCPNRHGKCWEIAQQLRMNLHSATITSARAPFIPKSPFINAGLQASTRQTLPANQESSVQSVLWSLMLMCSAYLQ